MLGGVFKTCEICKAKRLWFQVKQREFKPNEFMPLIKNEKKMCGKCFKGAKNYNWRAN